MTFVMTNGNTYITFTDFIIISNQAHLNAGYFKHYQPFTDRDDELILSFTGGEKCPVTVQSKHVPLLAK